MRIFIDLLTLCHLHTDRAQTPLQSNMLEAGDIKRESEKEWYYSDSSNQQQGPFSIEEFKRLYQEEVVR